MWGYCSCSPATDQRIAGLFERVAGEEQPSRVAAELADRLLAQPRQFQRRTRLLAREVAPQRLDQAQSVVVT